jgi:hypothetical protein
VREGDEPETSETFSVRAELVEAFRISATCSPNKRRTLMKYKGTCHCGKVAFEAEGELSGAMACNCSMCSRKGSLLWFVPRDQLHVLTPEEDIGTYTFNKHIIKHRFCQTCGIHPYGEGTDPKGNRMAAINIRCLEGIDLESVPVQHFDGRSL